MQQFMPKKENDFKPMLAKTGTIEDLERTDYIFEPKLDGIRVLCHINKTISLYTRTGRNITKQFPEITATRCVNTKTSCVLDGEIIVYNAKGIPDFNLIQGRYQLESEHDILQQAENLPATLVVFDILEKNHQSVCDKPLLERKKILSTIFHKAKTIELIPYTYEGKKLWKLMKKMGAEGVMAKEAESIYYPGRRVDTWRKIKFVETVDCIIIGYVQEKRAISALALGLYNKKKIVYMGKVGTGFTENDIKMLYEKIEKIPQTHAPSLTKNIRSVIWIKPQLVCEIRYQEITKDGHFRKPVFIHLRPDKKPTDCTILR
jgi:bifunctional non-homologous end joining protein LigD